jgi:hypothetical protein
LNPSNPDITKGRATMKAHLLVRRRAQISTAAVGTKQYPTPEAIRRAVMAEEVDGIYAPKTAIRFRLLSLPQEGELQA